MEFLVTFSTTTCISFTKLRFRRSFWGGDRVWIFFGSKVITQIENISVSVFLRLHQESITKTREHILTNFALWNEPSRLFKDDSLVEFHVLFFQRFMMDLSSKWGCIGRASPRHANTYLLLLLYEMSLVVYLKTDHLWNFVFYFFELDYKTTSGSMDW